MIMALPCDDEPLKPIPSGPIRNIGRTAAMLCIGAVGVVALGVQSAMYGSLERAGRIDVAEIGLAASAEMVALALGVVLASRLARHVRPPLLACLAAAVLVLANLAMLRAAGPTIVGARVVAGISGGVMLWLANAYIVLSHRVVRMAALFLIVQTAMQFSTAAGAATFAPDFADAIPLIMAGCGVLAMALAPVAGGWMALPEDHEDAPVGGFGKRGVLALLLMALVQFSLVGGWILVELVGEAANLPTGTVAAATPVMLAAQVVGGLMAMTLSQRLSWTTAMIATGSILAAVQLAMGFASSGYAFLGLAFVYGLLWNFALPQLTPMALASDPSLRVARLGPAAVVAGAALGPLASAGLAGAISPAAATMAFALPSLAIGLTAVSLRRVNQSARRGTRG